MQRGVIAIRLSKIVMTGGMALWTFLVTVNNIVDYESNWQFVQHVLSMDTIFPDSALKDRAITDPVLQTAAYVAIIVGEGLTSIAFLAASGAMAWHLMANGAAFANAKAWTAVGVMLGFAVWAIGFMAIAGEWFAMWQSATWNGLDAALRFTVTLLAVGIYVLLDNDGATA